MVPLPGIPSPFPTSIDSPIATFSSATAIRGSDLNSNFTQVLYAAQEANDSSFDTAAPSLTGPLNMNGYKVTSLGTPTSNTDAATKAYVDARTLSDGVRGEITISGGGGTLTVNNQAITAAKIQDNTITATQIATGAIGADELADNAVDSNAISAGAVTTSKIANGAVTATQIAADTITSSQIAADAITASELATGAVDNDAIGVGVITGDRLASKTITNAQIADNTIGAGQIANGAIGQAQIATNGVGSDEIAARAVTFAKTPEIMTNKLLGRSTAGNGDIEQIGIGANLSLSGGVLSATGGGGGGGGGTVTDNDYGDIVVSNSGATWTIDSMVVTGAKIAANTIES
ncbi:MAG: phage tail fiber protein, partial [Aquiluna sp.]